MLIIQEISDSSSKPFLLYGSYLVPGGGVTFVWSTMLEHVFKVPLHSEDSETIIIWSHKRDAAATKRTLWRLMTVQPTSINLKSLKNVSCSSFFKRLPMTVFKSVKLTYDENLYAFWRER